MKRLALYLVLPISLILNVGAGCIWFTTTRAMITIWKNVDSVLGNHKGELADKRGLRLRYVDRQAGFARDPHGAYWFCTPNDPDLISLAKVPAVSRKNPLKGGMARMYLLAARDFFVTWGYGETGGCVNVSLQYNDNSRLKDDTGDGNFVLLTNDKRFYTSQRAMEIGTLEEIKRTIKEFSVVRIENGELRISGVISS